MSGIMSLFFKSAAKPATASTGDKNQDPNSKVDPNTDPSKKLENKSPDGQLDIFKGLFDNANPKEEDKAPSFSLDQEKVKQLVGSLGFSPELTPELAQKLQSGDSAALKEVLDTVGRNAYSKILSHLPQLTEAYVNSRLEHDRKGLGGQVKSQLTMQSLKEKAASNPVLEAQMEDVGKRLLSKYPDASPDWLAQKTVEYFLYTAKQLSPDAFKAEGDTDKEPPRDHLAGDGNNPDFWANWMSGQPPQTTKT